MAKKKNKTPTKKQLEMLERQNEVLDLFMSGLSVRAISAYQTSQGVSGSSVGNVFADIEAALKNARQNLRLKAENLLELELKRLDKMSTAVYTRAIRKGHPSDIESMLSIMRQRDKYLQISKSEKTKNSAAEALAKLLGKSPEEFPSADA